MEHIQKRNDYLIENDAEQKVIPVNYDEKNLLFLSQLCKACMDAADKSLITATLMASLGLEWEEFKNWFESRYIGKQKKSND